MNVTTTGFRVIVNVGLGERIDEGENEVEEMTASGFSIGGIGVIEFSCGKGRAHAANQERTHPANKIQVNFGYGCLSRCMAAVYSGIVYGKINALPQ